MIRKPVVRTQTPQARNLPVTAPVGGWNARDPIADMAKDEAIVLDNWFPRAGDCVLRGGIANHVTGFASRPRTLVLHTPPSGSKRMFASTASAVYDVSSAGALGASVASCTNGYWNWVQMGVSGGHYLMMFNGVDKPLYYDGTTWTSVDGVSTPAITGVTTTLLVSANIFKRRLFLVETGKMGFWYLPVDQVGGAAAYFPLGPLTRKGGYLMAIGTWTIDSGDGLDDRIVFITSEGEALIFAGSNPASSVDWALVGVYEVPKPIGRKCLIKYAGDLLLLTEFGAFPLSKALTPAQSAAIQDKFALTNIIDNAFTQASNLYRANEGWEMQLYAPENALIFNIPTDANGSSVQFVMNTITKRWCQFTGWNVSSVVVFNNELYVADTTKVSKAWTGVSDYGNNIVGYAQTAYWHFKEPGRVKNWQLLRPNFVTTAALSYTMTMLADFQSPVAIYPIAGVAISGAIWDTSLWDSAMWSSGPEVQQAWLTPRIGTGFFGSTLLQLETKTAEVSWIATNYIYSLGGVFQ